MSHKILKTKLYVPPTHSETIARPRLLTQLNDNIYRRLTLLSAPAGFGKTTLVSQWVADRRFELSNPLLEKAQQNPRLTTRLVWLSLDENDNNTRQFFTYLIAALQQIDPCIGHTVQGLLQSSQPLSADSIIATLINDLATLPHPIILVMDDYHSITSPELHEVMTFLINYIPPQMHLIIMTRIAPPWPLHLLRARGQMFEIGPNDLRFNFQETALLLKAITGLNFSADDVKAIEARTEGWVTGLYLAALSIQEHNQTADFISNFTGSHHYILDYLTQEIFYRQPETVQSFLLETAILARLSGPLCEAVTHHEDSQALLANLAHTNLFVVPLDNQRQWYRYHHLFAELLDHQLRQSYSTAQINQLHQRAASWCAENDLLHEAVQHALAAEDLERVERLIQDNMGLMYTRGELTIVQGWLEALPEDWRRSRPVLSLIYAWILFSIGKVSASQQLLQQIEQQLRLHPDAFSEVQEPQGDCSRHNGTIEQKLNALKAQVALTQGDIAGSIDLSRQLLAHLPQENVIWRGMIALNLATAYWLNGDMIAAEKTLAEYRTLSQVSDDTAAMIATSNLAELQRMHGRYHQAASLYRRVLELAAKEGQQVCLPTIIGLAHVDLGLILYEWDDLEAAFYHLNQGIELGKRGAGPRVLVMGYCGLAHLSQVQGEFEAANSAIQQAKAVVDGLEIGGLLTCVQLAQTDLWIAQGNLAEANRWLPSHQLIKTTSVERIYEFEQIVHARLLFARGKFEAALELLAHLQATAEAEQQNRTLIISLTLQALVHQAQLSSRSSKDTMQSHQVFNLLRQALMLGEQEGYIRIFLDEGAPMAALLLKFIQTYHPTTPMSLPTTGYVHRLLQAFKIGILPTQDVQPAVGQLLVDSPTDREIEVLRLIAGGLSNREITDELVITKNTLRTHIKNIYSKLGTHNRIQAITRAKELNLV